MKVLEQTDEDVLIEMSPYELVLMRRFLTALIGEDYGDKFIDIIPLSKSEMMMFMNVFNHIHPFYFDCSN